MSSPSLNTNTQIIDDFELLDLMMKDTKKLKDVYQPGPYWLKKTQTSVNEIKKFGISNFRGIKSGVSTSFGDNAFIDIRGSYNFGIRVLLSKIFRDIYPFNRLFDSQVHLTLNYYNYTDELNTDFH